MSDVDENFVQGNSRRIFLNTELGCSSSCTYCYLPQLGFPIGARLNTKRATAQEVLDSLGSNADFVPGNSGTLISIGCFSECWDPKNRGTTIEIIRKMLPLGNRIQLATKRRIKLHELQNLEDLPGAKSQLSIYVSSATLAGWSEYEPGTAPPEKRFLSFEACRLAGLTAFLYIKPVIQNVTIKDVETYGLVMQKYSVDVIVGDRFDTGEQVGQVSPISRKLKIIEESDVARIKCALQKYGRVFGSSTETI